MKDNSNNFFCLCIFDGKLNEQQYEQLIGIEKIDNFLLKESFKRFAAKLISRKSKDCPQE